VHIKRMSVLGDNLRRLRGSRKQREIAAAVDVKTPTVSQWELGREKPGRDRLVRLAKFFGVTVEELLGDGEINGTLEKKASVTETVGINIGQRRPSRAVNLPAQDARDWPQNVPVMGTGAAGRSGDFALNGNIVEYVKRPPGIATAAQVFAIWVSEDSMFPRFSSGDLVYVHPGRQPRPGDDVLIELAEEPDGTRPAFVKRFVKQTTTELIIEQFNPPDRITLALSVVASVFKILTLAELIGLSAG
jgi:phage repressor protein C with HTH and peptisase S24 domain